MTTGVLAVALLVLAVPLVPLVSAAGTPNVGYSGPSVTPTTVPTGSPVDANVTVSNTGTGTGTYNVSVTVDGTVEQWANGTIAAGATKTVWIEETLWTTGDRTVTVAGGSASATATVSVTNANPKYHGGPRNLGWYPNQTGPTSTPVPAWNISEGTPQVMQSTIVDGVLYTAFHDGGKFYALDPETGAQYWTFTPPGGTGSTWTSPAYADSVLYIGSNDYKLHAIDAATGTELWNYSTQTNVRSAPAVVDGVVYFGSNDGNLTALNATTGEELWFYTTYQPVLVESNPAVVDGVVYVGMDDRNVTALNADDGSVRWRFPVVDETQSDPTVVDDTVFIGSDSTMGQTSGTGQIYAIDATDGQKRWNYSVTGDVDGGLVYADGTIFGGSRGGDFVALNATDGGLEWSLTGTDFRGAPVVVGGIVYVSDFGNGSVHAFDARDGTELWSYTSPDGNLYPTPLVWNNFVYYGSVSHLWAIEQPAPSITNVAATNPSGQDVQVSFDSDTQLATISVSISGAESATLTTADFTETANGGTYSYTAIYAGSSDGTYTATVDTATDAQGVDGATGESDSVTVDTTPPTITNYTVDNPSGQDVQIDFEASEQLGSITVGITGAESATLTLADFTETTAGSNYTYATTYAGSSDGTYNATLAVVNDTAGNGLTDVANDSVTVDTTPPTISNLTATNPSGQDVRVAFESDEQLASISVSISGAETGTLTTGDFTETTSGGTYTYTATYEGSTNGNYTATLDSATDAAGNDGAGGESDTVEVSDSTPPDISGYAVTNPAGQDVQVTFDASEQLATISVSISGAETGTLTTGDFTETTSGANYTYSATYAGSSDGTYTATLDTASDAAGNDGASNESGSVTVDTTAPAISNYAVANPGGQDVRVSFETDEQLASVSVSVTGAESATLTTADFSETTSGSTYAYTATYAGSSDGTYTATLDTASDAAGNDGASGESDSVTIDTTAPGVSNYTVTNPTGQDVGVSFETDEQLATVSVSVTGAESATLTTGDFTETTSGGIYSYTATHAGASDGTYTATLDTASDATGNDGASGEADSVTVDTTAPAISNFSVANPAAQDVRVRFDANEQLASVSVSIGGAESTSLTEANFTESTGGGNYSYTATYAGSSDGTYSATLDAASDAAGNDGASGEADSVRVDTVTPDIANLSVSNPAGQDVSVAFESDEQLATVSAAIGGVEAATLGTSDFTETTSGGSGSTYTYTATYAGSSDGTYDVSLDTASDAAGNDGATGQSGRVVVDTSSPTARTGPNRTVTPGQSVDFDGRNSTDVVGVVSYTWDFDDGSNATGATATHSYSTKGTFTVTLTVADAAGHTDVETVAITVVSASTGPGPIDPPQVTTTTTATPTTTTTPASTTPTTTTQSPPTDGPSSPSNPGGDGSTGADPTSTAGPSTTVGSTTAAPTGPNTSTATTGSPPSGSSTPSPTTSTTDGGAHGTVTPGSGPGFGFLLALLALVGAAMFSARRAE